MKLTVATKIIGGFTIIVLFLIATSLISLNNLNTIHTSTDEENEIAIPTLKSSNKLANQLLQVGGLTLKGYYQTDLSILSKELQKLTDIKASFSKEAEHLKSIVKDQPHLSSSLVKVNELYNSLSVDVYNVYSDRKASIEQQTTLSEKVDELEGKADDTITLLFDLADHILAEDELKRAVGLADYIETLLNAIVSSAYEYRDIQDKVSTDLVGGEITSTIAEAKSSLNNLINELNFVGLKDIATEITNSFNEVEAYIQGSNSFFNNKYAQLKAISSATTNLISAEKGIVETNSILNKQVEIANNTTVEAAKSVDDAVNSGTRNTWIIMIVSLLSAFGIGWVTLKSITKPLSRVNDMLNVVASGDLSKKLDESGHDEFAELSKNCNLLIDSLRSLIQSIVSRSTQLATAAEETSAVTAQSTTAIEEQRAQVEQAASATTEMSSTSQSVLTSANDALGEIKQADDEAERVKVISVRNRNTIEILAKEVDDASQVINQLQQDSASIGSILDVIRGIADQTNLLALNAAIEAARAGEQGRGFAVVADEVRTLASRTQESTEEIQSMITALQTGAEKAVSVMDTGKKQAANCVEQSQEADKALETITHAVHEAYDRSSQIATAAGEQSTVAHEISSNLESIVAIAEQTTAGSKQTAESSNEVAKLAEELQQSVQEFKL